MTMLALAHLHRGAGMKIGAALILAVMLAATATAYAQTPSEAVKAMLGAWEISNADRDKACAVTLKGEAVKGAYKLDMDKSCADALPFTREAQAWTIVNDMVRIIDARGRIILQFTEVEGGLYEGERPAEGLYFLQSLDAAGPAFPTAAAMAGEWNVLRETDKPICSLTLMNTAAPAADEGYALLVRPPCDAAVTRFNPASWRMDRGELVISSARGEAWRFAQDEAGWHRVPQNVEPLMLIKK
jgi:protease inhibitor Inh